MRRKRKHGFIEIHNEDLAFVTLGEGHTWDYLETMPLSDILDIDHPDTAFSARLKNYSFPLLIVPDFWFGNLKYPFHSHNKAVIRAFITRKLGSEFPHLLKVKDFFSSDIIKNEKGEQEIVTLFPQEQKFFDLYQVLTQNNIRPIRISSPALLWNKRLSKQIDNFDKIGAGLIYLFESRCSLFFYFKGHFLFSRTISLPEQQSDQADQFEIITYEINQSIYHFSQRTKADLDKIYISSLKAVDVQQLSETLGREIIELTSRPGHAKAVPGQVLREGTAADFSPEEILEPLSLPGVSDRAAVNELEWKRIQFAGFIAGFFLLIVFAFEFMFLTQTRDNEALSLSAAGADPTQQISQYNEALDVLLKEAEKKDPLDLVGRLASCVSGNIQVESLDVSMDPSTTISLTGIIKANGADDFSDSLRAFLKRINTNIQSSTPLGMGDVEIEEKKNDSKDNSQEYHISFKLDVS